MNKQQQKSHGSLSRPLQKIMSILDFDLKKEITKKLKTNKEITIVDIGCGVGRSLWELSDIFSANNITLNLYGIYFCKKPNKKSIFYNEEKRQDDARKNPLIIAKEFDIPTKNLSIPRLYNADAGKRIPLKNNSTDLIYSTNAFHFFKHKLGAIEEISRILKINGQAILNVDRTDNGFWSSKILLPRLRIYKDNKILNLKNILKEKAGNNFRIALKKVNSYGTGLDSYNLIITKLKDARLDFSEFKFDTKQSIDINKIRYSPKDINNILEYKKLINLDESFGKKIEKTHFGGFLSIYKK